MVSLSLNGLIAPQNRALKIYSRKLPERSYLAFQFPLDNGKKRTTYVPMLENCEISESKKANLISYDLIGRNSTLYAFGGGQSRQFNLRFKITLPHIYEMMSVDPLPGKFTSEFNPRLNLLGLNSAKVDITIKNQGMAKKHKDAYDKLTGKTKPEGSAFDGLLDGIFGTSFQAEAQRDPKLLKVVDLIMYWITVIRSGCINNSSNTTLGPPIVRLTHGIMYSNIPCVLEQYNISIEQDKGYDINTLIGKVININLTLSETRVGDFGTYNPSSNNQLERDNNYGWEAVFNHGTVDPGFPEGRAF